MGEGAVGGLAVGERPAPASFAHGGAGMDQNTERFLIALVTAIPPTLMALAALVSSIRNGRRTESVRAELNGKLTAMIAAREQAAYVRGQTDALAAAARLEAERVRLLGQQTPAEGQVKGE